MPTSVMNILPAKAIAQTTARGNESSKSKSDVKGEDFDKHLDGAKQAAGKKKPYEKRADEQSKTTPAKVASTKGGTPSASNKQPVGESASDQAVDSNTLPAESRAGDTEPVFDPALADAPSVANVTRKEKKGQGPLVVANGIAPATPASAGAAANPTVASAVAVTSGPVSSLTVDLRATASSDSIAPPPIATTSQMNANDAALSANASAIEPGAIEVALGGPVDRMAKAVETEKAHDAHLAAQANQKDVEEPQDDGAISSPRTKAVLKPAVQAATTIPADLTPPDPSEAPPVTNTFEKHIATGDEEAATLKSGLINGAVQTPGPTSTAHVKNALPVESIPRETRFTEVNHANIINSVKTNLMPHGGSMQIRLDPPELGALQVSVEMRDGAMTATFQTSNEDATRLLSHTLGELKTALESQGVTVEKIQVQQSPKDSHAKNGEDSSAQQQRDEANARQENDRREMLRKMWRRVSGTADPVDLVA